MQEIDAVIDAKKKTSIQDYVEWNDVSSQKESESQKKHSTTTSHTNTHSHACICTHAKQQRNKEENSQAHQAAHCSESANNQI